MTIQQKRIEEPLERLRKALKHWQDDPEVEDVHQLRTDARRLEAIGIVLELRHELQMKRVLKAMAAVRKGAGKVRDMDVLSELARSPEVGYTESSRDRLLEELKEMRASAAGDLKKTVDDNRKLIRHGLAKMIMRSEARFGASLDEGAGGVKIDFTAAQKQVENLRGWPRIRASNAHAFRIEVKKLRNMLMLDASADESLVDALGSVKDWIGEWHDWLELWKVAGKVLDPREDGVMLRRLNEVKKEKLAQALEGTDELRARTLADRSVSRDALAQDLKVRNARARGPAVTGLA